MAKTAQEYAQGLRGLADIWDKKGDADSPQPELHIFCYTKENLLATVRFIGGTWTKNYGEGEFASVTLTHKTLPIQLYIQRNKVCNRVIKYECEPMFSPDDDKDLDSELVGAA